MKVVLKADQWVALKAEMKVVWMVDSRAEMMAVLKAGM
jgi:hypothetical protein